MRWARSLHWAHGHARKLTSCLPKGGEDRLPPRRGTSRRVSVRRFFLAVHRGRVHRGCADRGAVDTPHARPAWLRYSAAIALTGIISLAAHELDPYWDLSGGHPYLIEWPAIVAAAWFGGLRPGLLAVALSALAIVFFWIEPAHSLFVRRPTDLVAVGLFALCGVVVSLLIERLHLARQRERDLRRAREVLLGVVAHDLRNPLNSIAGAVSLARRNRDDVRAFDLAARAVGRMNLLIRDLVD
ncbi:MAG: DUF4118 domain-containing protein, partial [Polyangiaceae bacterium]